ncbi:fibulin-2 [Nematostella vectensis]|uniref:fibulin-2 n=1 Tax=Nematostella vectensis TaxID=45351 RepID=UPI00207746D0|nr:fibulin-2 [Nematostella vectensis]
MDVVVLFVIVVILGAVEHCQGQIACWQNVTTWQGVLKSPGHPGSYQNNLDCYWLIAVSPGNMIQITFKELELSSLLESQSEQLAGCPKDYIEIRHGNNVTSPLLRPRICDAEVTSDLQEMTSNSTTLLIHLHTDISGGNRGFLLLHQGICNRRLSYATGEITSPNYPSTYPAQASCSWVIDRGAGFSVQLIFREFELENHTRCLYDYVKVQDGGLVGSPTIARLCGKHENFSLTTNGPMRISLVSDKHQAYSGFRATYSTSDKDECQNNPCPLNSICSNTIGSYDCACQPNYVKSGERCIIAVDYCLKYNYTCSEFAQCFNGPTNHTCACKQGYSGNGTYCADINECTSNFTRHRCHNKATCTNTIGSYDCACVLGYTGSGLECVDVNECSTRTHNCHFNSTCTNTVGSYLCACKGGFTGDGVACVDVDECVEGNQCHSNATCNNTIGEYTCTCNVGFTGDGYECNDTKECDDGSHLCDKHAICTNTLGRFNCTCVDGFHGNGTHCKDVDECAHALHNCHTHAICINTVGSFNCSCEAGFHGNGIDCKDMDECALSHHACHALASCSNTIGSYTCSCNDGFQGDGRYCGDINECMEKSHDCRTGSICINKHGSFTCPCRDGYVRSGMHCEPETLRSSSAPSANIQSLSGLELGLISGGLVLVLVAAVAGGLVYWRILRGKRDTEQGGEEMDEYITIDRRAQNFQDFHNDAFYDNRSFSDERETRFTELEYCERLSPRDEHKTTEYQSRDNPLARTNSFKLRSPIPESIEV